VFVGLCSPGIKESTSKSAIGKIEMSVKDKSISFTALIAEVQACRKCGRMAHSARVLNHGAGNLRAKAMFIGEAPGRLGADETELPFHGDTAGHNFEDLLASANIDRAAIYITNAVLCNPKDAKGNNATPIGAEISNCSGFLRRQLDLVDPSVVVTLGAVALEAVAAIAPHGLSLKKHVRTKNSWQGRALIPLYHPGQRAMIHRSLANQRSDYQFVAETLKRLDTDRWSVKSPTKGDVLSLAKYIIGVKGRVSYFELHKLAYLAEYLHVRKTGARLTKGYFIRQKDGPYCTDLQLGRLQRAEPALQVTRTAGQLFLSLSSGHSSHLFAENDLGHAAQAAIDDAVQRYSYASEADLKTAVYMTAPMRNILRKEQTQKLNMFNAPIDFLAAR
jgi:uracil-DNA glycosylase family 4